MVSAIFLVARIDIQKIVGKYGRLKWIDPLIL